MPAIVLISVWAHAPALTTNRVSGVIILVISVLCILATGGLPLLSVQNLEQRDKLYELPQVRLTVCFSV